MRNLYIDRERFNQMTLTYSPALLLALSACGGSSSGKPAGRTITGTFNADNLDGGAGDDIMQGFEGSDVMRGHAGNDEISGSAGNDIMFGGTGNDLIRGHTGDDTLNGGPGYDVLTGDYDDPQLDGGPGGDDILDGGSGKDLLFGGADNDKLSGGSDSDYLDGGKGNDRLKSEGGDDWLDGDEGRDTLEGGTGNDWLDGGEDEDDEDSGDGIQDTLEGGPGQDIFFIDNPEGSSGVADLITDFNINDDKLAFGPGTSGVWFEKSSGMTYIYDTQAKTNTYAKLSGEHQLTNNHVVSFSEAADERFSESQEDIQVNSANDLQNYITTIFESANIFLNSLETITISEIP